MTTTETKLLGMTPLQAALVGALAGIFCVTLATLAIVISVLFSVNANTSALRAEMVANDNAHRAEMNAMRSEMNAMRSEMNAMRSEMNANDKATREELAEVKLETVKINGRLDSIEGRLANVERLLPEYDALHARIDAVERGQAALDDRVDALAASPSE